MFHDVAADRLAFLLRGVPENDHPDRNLQLTYAYQKQFIRNASVLTDHLRLDLPSILFTSSYSVRMCPAQLSLLDINKSARRI